MTRFPKTMLLAAALLALAAAGAAPDRNMAKGLKFGLALADMKGAGAEPGLTPQAGFTAGAFLTLPVTGLLSIQPEVLLTQKGAESESGPKPYEYRFTYIEFPVLGKLHLAGRSAAFRPNIYAGPFLGVKVGALLDTYLDPSQEESVEESLPAARSIDAGFVVGAGLDVLLGPGRILLDVRYGGSLLDAFTAGGRVRHRVLSVCLGYSFD
jgi:hypothetical protein